VVVNLVKVYKMVLVFPFAVSDYKTESFLRTGKDQIYKTSKRICSMISDRQLRFTDILIIILAQMLYGINKMALI